MIAWRHLAPIEFEYTATSDELGIPILRGVKIDDKSLKLCDEKDCKGNEVDSEAGPQSEGAMMQEKQQQILRVLIETQIVHGYVKKGYFVIFIGILVNAPYLVLMLTMNNSLEYTQV